MLIECDQPAVTELQGTQYQFRPDESGRNVCQVHNLRHNRLLLAVIDHYKEAEPDLPAELTELVPATAEIGGADVAMAAIGLNFREDDVIVFDGVVMPTAIDEDNALTTIVNASLATVAGPVPVLVRRGTDDTDPLDFTFTEPVVVEAAAAAADPNAPPAAPPSGDPIPVTDITGIGPATATKLAGEGITDARQIAALTDAEATDLDDRLGLGGRMPAWVEQARALVA